MNNKRLNRGDKFEMVRTTPFGKKITEKVIVVARFGNQIMLDNGLTLYNI